MNQCQQHAVEQELEISDPTPGPWATRNGRIYQADRENLTIANIARAFDGDYSEANARRIVACVNACAGMDNPKEIINGLHVARDTLAVVSKQRDELLDELERERMRLVACGVVAMSDTPDSAAKARDMHPDYQSASCDDVARRVDECISLRKQRDELLAALEGCAKLDADLNGEAIAAIASVKGGAA